MTTLFPSNPSHGMIFELSPGLFFKYDGTVNSWIKIASNVLKLTTATPSTNGAMSAADLNKLNRLVLPPPFSSIVGTDCAAPFRGGNIEMFSGDPFVNVDGNVNVQNINSQGARISRSMPFQIHQRTYGFDFTIDFPSLIGELKERSQFNMVGKQGVAGAAGADGDDGPNFVLSGPAGNTGVSGFAPPCELNVEVDSLQAQPHDGMSKALVAVKVVRDEIDHLKYKLVFDRQQIGSPGHAADKFRVRADQSPWVLAVPSDMAQADALECEQMGVGNPQSVYYLDVEPIIDSIRSQYLKEVDILRKGYEDVVGLWVNTMSDLFDEQKAAMCCALEFCLSATKSTELRQHMESTAAQAAGSANILLHGRNSKESVAISSTSLLKQIGGPDLCDKGGPAFPQYPDHSKTDGDIAKFSISDGVDRAIITVDPLIHFSPNSSVKIPLLPGNYIATIDKTDAQIENSHRANVRIQYFKNGVRKNTKFLDKGSFLSAADAQMAYKGLSLSFSHEGGMASFWLPSSMPQDSSGTVLVVVEPAKSPVEQKIPELPVETVEVPEVVIDMTCELTLSHLAWYEKSWVEGNCCGLVVNVMGQDYIVVKRSVGDDLNCGGGESESTPCLQKFGRPAFAWPTFDGRQFAPLPQKESIVFRTDERLNKLIVDKIMNGDFLSGKGNPAGIRHLSYQLSKVLFPIN